MASPEYYQSYSYTLTELKKNLRPPSKRASLCQFTNSMSTARHLLHSPFWRGGDAVNFLSPWVTSEGCFILHSKRREGQSKSDAWAAAKETPLFLSNSEISILFWAILVSTRNYMVVLKFHLIYPFVSRKAYTSPNRAVLCIKNLLKYRFQSSPLIHSSMKLSCHFLQKDLLQMLNLNMEESGYRISSHGFSGNQTVGHSHWNNHSYSCRPMLG